MNTVNPRYKNGNGNENEPDTDQTQSHHHHVDVEDVARCLGHVSINHVPAPGHLSRFAPADCRAGPREETETKAAAGEGARGKAEAVGTADSVQASCYRSLASGRRLRGTVPGVHGYRTEVR